MKLSSLVSASLIAAVASTAAVAQEVSGIDVAKAASLFAEAKQAMGSINPPLTTVAAKLLGQYHEAQNRGDLTAVMALFAEDATFVAPPICLPSCMGTTQIQRAIEQRIRDYNQQHLIDVQTSGNVATSRTDWRSDPTRNAGVIRRIAIEIVEARDGKIVRYATKADLSDPETAKFQAFVEAAVARTRATSAPLGSSAPRR